MLSQHLEKKIISNLSDIPTEGQKSFIRMISDFVLKAEEDEIFLLTGYAGTGKTTVIAALINVLEEHRIKTVLMAPTGRAAKVLGSFSGKPAFTIHKKIYRQKSTKDGFGKFVLGKNLGSGLLFIVDEASMIGTRAVESSIFGSGNLLEDLLEFIYSGKNCKLILIGDNAQLPPVNMPESSILKNENLKALGFSVTSTCLTEVVRQDRESGILYNSTLIRLQLDSKKLHIPKLELAKFNDIKSISGNDLINEINESYDKFGIEDTIVITRSNKRANLYNAGIRKSILYREEQITKGDYLMVVKNNYFWLQDENEVDFIANGDIVQVVKLGKFEERFGFHFVNVKLRLIDLENREIEAKIILETLYIESAALTQDDNKKLFYAIYEDYKNMKPKKTGFDAVKNNPYFNALQVKFAYAITCHKSQGGQWKSVFVDQGYFVQDMLNEDYLKWLYTAFTRATEKLNLVNFSKDFFVDE
jgi:exodeoxyribonuclease V